MGLPYVRPILIALDPPTRTEKGFHNSRSYTSINVESPAFRIRQHKVTITLPLPLPEALPFSIRDLLALSSKSMGN